MDSETCETCRFRSDEPAHFPDHENTDQVMWHCQRNAPVVTGGMMSHVTTVWPTVAGDYWCGEYRRKSDGQ